MYFSHVIFEEKRFHSDVKCKMLAQLVVSEYRDFPIGIVSIRSSVAFSYFKFHHNATSFKSHSTQID